MITWFSAMAAPRARHAALGLVCVGALLALSSRAARADEARLTAARAAAGAGRVAEARALYGQALAAGLVEHAQALVDAGEPRPTSVTSLANEQSDELPEAPAAPEAAPRANAPRADAPRADAPRADAPRASDDEVAAQAREAAAREAAEREAAAKHNETLLARERAAREEEARWRAVEAARAATVVAASPALPAPEPPAVFQAGLRAGLSATDPDGGKHRGAGLMFTWLTFATPRGRGAVVVDLESTRFRAGRDDTMNRGQVAFYGLGFDWTLPLARNGTGVFLGAEATAGVLQGSTKTSSIVQSGGVVQVMPHAGAGVAYRGVGLFADAGWRVQVLSPAGSASESGLVLQGGLRVEMAAGDARAPTGFDRGSFDLGYAARVYAPNGSNVYSRYGGLPFASGTGPMLGHELTLTTGAHLPRHADHGLSLTYLGADRAGGGAGLNVVGLGYVATWHAFAARQLLNPYVGLRLGLDYISSGDKTSTTFSYAAQVGAVASGSAGVDVAVARQVAVRLGVSYDAVAYANRVPNGSLSGYAALAGLIVRL